MTRPTGFWSLYVADDTGKKIALLHSGTKEEETYLLGDPDAGPMILRVDDPSLSDLKILRERW